jgi:TolB-like protein/Tfp pilus assembly protein PilF/tRNA A-37 threonylcarbamoyl transferase component Bud32
MTDTHRLPPGRRIERYEIVSLIGAGGMGEVYLARDTQLDRHVALKLLPASHLRDEERVRRFAQEARAASGLNHPNILTVHEIGQSGDVHFIATEFIEGRTLRQRMAQGALPVPAVLDIAIQVAGALDAAHAAGVVHRDIKPENVMVREDGYVKVLDFGLAKLVETAGADPASAATHLNTVLGVVMGTVDYMSPEQARGDMVDRRTDLFSLGVMLDEMLAPVPDVPVELERIVAKAMRKDRETRYQSAADLRADLKSLATELTPERASDRTRAATTPSAGGSFIGRTTRGKATVAFAFLLIAALGAGAWYLSISGSSIDSIAVLPFINESKDLEVEYLSDGISDGLINRLSQLPMLRVMSLSAVLRYKGQTVDPRAVGDALNVRAVLVGRMSHRGTELSVSAELVDARDNTRLWGNQYDNRRVSDIQQIQEQISRDIAAKLRLTMSREDETRFVKHDTPDSEAYRLYLRGRFHWNKFSDEGFTRSIEFFKQAIAQDPRYARAYAGLADAYSLQGEMGVRPPHDVFPHARRAAEQALDLDSALAEAHLSLAVVKLFYDWNVTSAMKEISEARSLDPHNPQVHHFYGHALQFAGRLDEAKQAMERAVELDPVSLILNTELGFATYVTRQYGAAVIQYRKTLEIDPRFTLASWWLAQALEQEGRHEEARTVLNSAGAVSDSLLRSELGCVEAATGRRAEARKIVDELIERRAREYIDPTLIAYIYIALGDKDQAFAWLDRGYQERAGNIPWMHIEPKFDPIRSDPRFADLVRRIGLTSQPGK